MAIGNTGSYTSSIELGFTAPSSSLKRSTAVPANYLEKITASYFPIGDSVIVLECDSSVNPGTNLSTDCDSATAISGTVASTGKVVFTPTGMNVKVGKNYVETGTVKVARGGWLT